MLMLCLGIACIYVIPVRLSRAITRSSVICTLLFLYTVSGRNRMTAMAKVRLLAVLTMDGCPAETTGLSGRWLGSDQYGIGALKEAATCVLTEDTSLTLLSSRMENTGDSLNYLIEATEKTAGIINGMIRMRLVDEIILYMVPVIAGNGSRLFQSSLPESEWTCTGSRQWKDGMVRIAYGRKTPRQRVVTFGK